jgi:hypothetical protein
MMQVGKQGCFLQHARQPSHQLTQLALEASNLWMPSTVVSLSCQWRQVQREVAVTAVAATGNLPAIPPID